MPLRSQTGTDRRWIALAVLVAAQFMVVLDVAIVNVALPSIKTDLHFTQSSLQWVITAYALMFGGFLLLGGRMADLLGRRSLFIAGVIALHRQLPARRLRLVRKLADRLPGDPGVRRRAARSRGIVDPDHDVRRRARAQHRARRLGRGLGQWGRCRRAARRPAHELARLVLDLLHQRPGRNRRRRAQPVPHSRESGRPQPPPLRRRWRHVTVTGGLMLLVYAMTRATTTIGWGTTETIGLLVGSAALIVGFRRDRAALEGAAAADAHLPAPHAHRRERDRLPARNLRLLAVLPRHPLHAAGPALLGDRDGRRLPALDVDDHRCSRASRRAS